MVLETFSEEVATRVPEASMGTGAGDVALVGGLPPGGLTIPEDLAERVGAVRLIQSVLAAAADAGLPSFGAVRGALEPSDSRRTMLALWLYGLARGLGGARDIVDGMQADPALRYLASRLDVDWRQLHVFRRRHVAVIELGLVRVLVDAGLGDGLGQGFARDAFRAEARGRLQRAGWCDQVSGE